MRRLPLPLAGRLRPEAGGGVTSTGTPSSRRRKTRSSLSEVTLPGRALPGRPSDPRKGEGSPPVRLDARRMDFASLRCRNVEIPPIRKFFCADLSTTLVPPAYFLPQLAGGNGTYDRTSQASAALAMTRTVAGTASLASRRSRSGGMEVRRLSQTTATRPIRAILRIGKAKGEVKRQPGAGDRATVSH